jgi:hypothetical protein
MRGVALVTGLSLTLFGVLPSTSNYRLNSYGFGSGGTANSSTATYSLEGSTGQLSGAPASTANAQTKPGYIQTQQANVPKLVSLDNNGGQYYNKLHFIIDNQNNPSDAKFLIAVSTDNFVSNIRYLQADGTLSSTLSTSQYQTYSAWGGASGSVIIGLLPSTTYSVKLRATQGKFTESAYGPITSQATAAPTLTFDLTTSTQSVPPFSVSLGTLTAGSINTTAQTINTSFSTNGTTGGNVYLSGQYGGLKSTSTGYQINAVSSDLSSLSEGFGAQNSSVGQTSGGPYSVVSPYNGSGSIVGIISGTARSLYTSNNPVTAGLGTLILKAKSTTTSIAANDYQEVLTFVAAANF